MIARLVGDAIGSLLIIALVLQHLHYGWFKKYAFAITTLSVFIVRVVIGLVYGVILSIPSIAVASVKALLTVVLSVVIALTYLLTYVVPYVGGRVEQWKDALKGRVPVSYFAVQVHTMRGIMIRIVAEEDNQNPEFENPGAYRTELARVRQNAKNRLETGETTLSIALGAVLLSAKLMNFKLLQASLFGFPVDLLIEAWLLTIAVSIIYRSSILDFLAYSPDDEFESLEVMDVALSYQKGVSLIGFVQGLMLLVVFIAAISRVKYTTVEEVLRAKYTNEPWIAFTWKKLTE